MLFFVNCLSIIFSINKESKPNHLLGKILKDSTTKLARKCTKISTQEAVIFFFSYADI